MQTPTGVADPTTPERVTPHRGPLRRGLRSGWPPVGLLWVATTATLWFYEVPPTTTIVFTLHLALGVALPGTLWWRCLGRGGGFFVADVAAGLALGYIGEVFVYVGARLLGLPLLVLAWPVGTVAVFLSVPALRRYWRGTAGAPVPPLLWRWCLTVIAGMTVLWSVKFYRWYGLRYPYNSTPDTDSTFHLALVGEARHHMPMTVPWITGEPLWYHWFVYPELAASSWVTGIEPQVLLLRLSMLPMLMAFAALVAVLARKVTGGWWSGVAASALTLFVLSPNPYQWATSAFYTNLAFSALEDGSSLRLTVWSGPTQTFGALLMVPLMIVLVDRLREPRDGRGWALFAVLLAGVMGAKATYLPLLCCGLLLAVGVELLRHRTLHRGALTGLGITAAGLVFSQVVLFGGTSQGMELKPLTTLVTGALGRSTGYAAGEATGRLLVLLALLLCCWVCIWAGLAGLLRRRLPEPAVVTMIGIGVAGAGVTLLTGQAGDSQRFFIEAARPYLSVAAIAGLCSLLPAGRLTARRAWALIGFVVLGVVVTQAVQAGGSGHPPTVGSTGSYAALTRAVVLPYAALAGVAVAVAAALLLARRWVPAVRGMVVALVVALLAGYGGNTSLQNYATILRDSTRTGWKNVVKGDEIVADGVLEAGRWLRDHSDPDDLVATNAHCQRLGNECTNLHFSMSAYSERRMLVEGWGFTTTTHTESARLGVWIGAVPYWHQQILADNDAAFRDPSSQRVALLRDRYGIRWLFVDESQDNVSPRLPEFATERYRSGVAAVYELPSA
ncbi:hypothetical protein ACFO1B_24250 [Dactylosporangium siamense]|uniref:hypothetical protein n=1 Tax=Dactylosporangium siamense TaxID=685454 RepID=UPI001942904B|nr:hypothetical protein [Dactylosporangium siamense]